MQYPHHILQLVLQTTPPSEWKVYST